MTTTATTQATVLRYTPWGPCSNGETIRVAVMETCPVCKTAEAHAVETQGKPELSECWVCCKLVTLPVDEAPEPELITSYEAHAAHTREACESKPRCSAARTCDEGMKLYEAMKRDESARRTPYVATSQWGRKQGCWTLKHATAHASVQHGEVIDQTHLFRIK